MWLFILTLTIPELQQLLSRGDYPSATKYYYQEIQRQPGNLKAIKNLARVYDHWHRFDSSLYWWEQALKINPKDDSAIIGRWQALYNLNKNDSLRLSEVQNQIAKETRHYLQDTAYQSLLRTYKGFSLANSPAVETIAGLLTLLYPDSAPVYELIGASFYDSLYPVWSNDTQKILTISRFLARYPKTEWRQTFYFYLLSSLRGLKDTFRLARIAEEMLNDDPLDPFRYHYAATIFNRLRFRPELAERYARRAIELEPGAKRPKNKPLEQWQLEYQPLYVLCRAALAEALLLQGKYQAALPYLNEAIAQFRWDVDNEVTPAPCYCLLGEVYEKLGKTDSAILGYIKTLTLGDSRNYWTSRADTGLMRLGITGSAQLALARQLLNYTGPVFTDVTEQIGLASRREARVAWGDYNNDGYDDLLLNGCRLFHNDRGKRFTEVTDSVGLTGIAGRGGIFADFNNDYWLDIYCAGADTFDRLLLNRFGRFTDRTESLGFPSDPFPTEGCGVADLDQDGWLDIYCANYENWEKHIYYPDRLYKNINGIFKDVTETAGIVPPYGEHLAGRGVNWADYDDDGDPDCYVSNYRLCQNFLWHNQGNGTFVNLALKMGVAGTEVNGWFGHTIGSVWADYDNDTDLDLFCANLAHPRYIEFSNRSMFYENCGPKARLRFVDRRTWLGIRYEETHADPAFADVDNDGDLDLYITSIYENRRSFLYLNQLIPNPRWSLDSGNWQFAEATYLSGTRAYNAWGCAFSDFDNDGDMDLVVGSGSNLRLFRNDTKNGNHWLRVKVIGTKHNASGIGARITVIQGKKRYIREVEGGKGTTSQNSLIQHFGLGSSNQPLTVAIRFGKNSTVTLKNVQPDQLLTVTEP
ncbi:MAG: FG-GAP-like repeat-containing protein [bacterium]